MRLIVCVLVLMVSFLTVRYGNEQSVKFGHIKEYRGRTIEVCGHWGCDTFDDITFLENNEAPIVEGMGVKVLDCTWSDVCGIYEHGYSTVPAVIYME
jgi:hypothetical protein